jgi:hypothetical protein
LERRGHWAAALFLPSEQSDHSSPETSITMRWLESAKKRTRVDLAA